MEAMLETMHMFWPALTSMFASACMLQDHKQRATETKVLRSVEAMLLKVGVLPGGLGGWGAAAGSEDTGD
jgi:hypothetical protein